MQTGNHEHNPGAGSAPGMAAGGAPSATEPSPRSGVAGACEGGGDNGRPDGRRGSAALGLRMAMPLALVLWVLVVTALWTLMH